MKEAKVVDLWWEGSVVGGDTLCVEVADGQVQRYENAWMTGTSSNLTTVVGDTVVVQEVEPALLSKPIRRHGVFDNGIFTYTLSPEGSQKLWAPMATGFVPECATEKFREQIRRSLKEREGVSDVLVETKDGLTYDFHYSFQAPIPAEWVELTVLLHEPEEEIP